MKTLKISTILAGAFTVAALSGRADDVPVFHHSAHLEEGAECVTCHDTDTEGLPTLKKDACAECHDEDVPEAWRLPARSRRAHVKFPHSTHVEAVEECKKCHGAVADESLENGALFVEPEGCFACHSEEGVEVSRNDCTACHGTDMKKKKPSTHDDNWSRKHGRMADWQHFEKHQYACRTCHRIGSDCQSCHRRTRPKSHTALWRMRGHGLAAGFDRERCRTCHETGSCIQCHRRTAPLNHKGAWRSVHGLAAQSRSNRHCATCHELSWCAACHAGKQ